MRVSRAAIPDALSRATFVRQDTISFEQHATDAGHEQRVAISELDFVIVRAAKFVPRKQFADWYSPPVRVELTVGVESRIFAAHESFVAPFSFALDEMELFNMGETIGVRCPEFRTSGWAVQLDVLRGMWLR